MKFKAKQMHADTILSIKSTIELHLMLSGATEHILFTFTQNNYWPNPDILYSNEHFGCYATNLLYIIGFHL